MCGIAGILARGPLSSEAASSIAHETGSSQRWNVHVCRCRARARNARQVEDRVAVVAAAQIESQPIPVALAERRREKDETAAHAEGQPPGRGFDAERRIEARESQ